MLAVASLPMPLAAALSQVQVEVDARLDALDDAAEQVVGEGRDLAGGVGLGLELVEDVVGVGGGPQVGVVGGDLAPARIVGVGGDVAGGVGHLGRGCRRARTG